MPPNLTRFFQRSHRVDEAPYPRETDAAYLSRLVRNSSSSSHRDDLASLTLRFAERAHLDLDTALMARTIAARVVTDATSSTQQRHAQNRLVAAAAVHAASLIRRRPVTLYRIARANGLGEDVLDAYDDLVRGIDRLEWGSEDRRAVFGDLEDHGRV